MGSPLAVDESRARAVLSKVAATFKFAFQANDGDRLYERFKHHYQEISGIINTLNDPTQTHERLGKNHPASYAVYIRDNPIFRGKGMERAYQHLSKGLEMNQFITAGQQLAKYIIQFKSIPKGKAKAVQQAAALFIKMRRAPRNLDSWWQKNAKFMQTMLESRTWPLKNIEDDSTEVYKLGPFEVHNTLGLADDDLAKTNKAIESAAKFLKSSRIPGRDRVLYGPIMVVGKLSQPRTLAWYYPSDDTVYLRAHTKVGKGEVHNLIHELAHRYWRKVFKNQREWLAHHRRVKNRGEGEEADTPEITALNDLKVGDVFPLPISGMIRGGLPRIIEITPTGWKLENPKGRGYITRRTVLQTMMNNSRRNKAIKHFPTPYSASDAEEHFAEAFALYAMNQLPVEHKEAFEEIVR